MAQKFEKIKQDIYKDGNIGINNKLKVENARNSTGKFQEGIASPMGSIAQESELVPKQSNMSTSLPQMTNPISPQVENNPKPIHIDHSTFSKAANNVSLEIIPETHTGNTHIPKTKSQARLEKLNMSHLSIEQDRVKVQRVILDHLSIDSGETKLKEKDIDPISLINKRLDSIQ